MADHVGGRTRSGAHFGAPVAGQNNNPRTVRQPAARRQNPLLTAPRLLPNPSLASTASVSYSSASILNSDDSGPPTLGRASLLRSPRGASHHTTSRSSTSSGQESDGDTSSYLSWSGVATRGSSSRVTERSSGGTSRYYTASPFTYTSSSGGEEQQEEEEDEETKGKRKEPRIPAFPVILIGLIAASAIALGAMHEEKPTTAPSDPQQPAANLTPNPSITTGTGTATVTAPTETVTVTAKDCPVSPADFDWVWICDEASRRRAFPAIDSDNDAEDFAHLSIHDMKQKKARKCSKAVMRAQRGYARLWHPDKAARHPLHLTEEQLHFISRRINDSAEEVEAEACLGQQHIRKSGGNNEGDGDSWREFFESHGGADNEGCYNKYRKFEDERRERRRDMERERRRREEEREREERERREEEERERREEHENAHRAWRERTDEYWAAWNHTWLGRAVQRADARFPGWWLAGPPPPPPEPESEFWF